MEYAVAKPRTNWLILLLLALGMMCLSLAIPVYADYFSGQGLSGYFSLGSSLTSSSHLIIGTSTTTDSYLSLGSPLALPANPTGLKMLSRTNDTISLSWTSAARAASYIVRYSTTTYPASPTAGTLGYSGANTIGSVTGLAENIQYYFAVWAVNASGDYSLGSSQYKTGTLTQALNTSQIIFMLGFLIVILYLGLKLFGLPSVSSSDTLRNVVFIAVIFIVGLLLLSAILAVFNSA